MYERLRLYCVQKNLEANGIGVVDLEVVDIWLPCAGQNSIYSFILEILVIYVIDSKKLKKNHFILGYG